MCFGRDYLLLRDACSKSEAIFASSLVADHFLGNSVGANELVACVAGAFGVFGAATGAAFAVLTWQYSPFRGSAWVPSARA